MRVQLTDAAVMFRGAGCKHCPRRKCRVKSDVLCAFRAGLEKDTTNSKKQYRAERVKTGVYTAVRRPPEAKSRFSGKTKKQSKLGSWKAKDDTRGDTL